MAKGRRSAWEEAARAREALRRGEVAPLYLLHGPEAFLRDEFLRLLRQAVLAEESRDFNYDRFDWSEVDASAVIDAARTLPFMAPRRLVEVHSFDELASDEADVLSALLEAPPETATVVFLAAKADMRKSFFRRFAAAGCALGMEFPSDREMPGWLRIQAEGLGMALAPEAASLLLDMVEPSLGRLRTELEKLAAYLGPDGAADEEAVRELVGRSRVEARYKLADALASGSAERGISLIRQLLEAGDRPEQLVGLLRNQVRRWAVAKAGFRRRVPRGELAGVLGVPPFTLERLEHQVRGMSAPFLRGLYGRLLSADRRIKRAAGGHSARHALELFVLETAWARRPLARCPT